MSYQPQLPALRRKIVAAIAVSGNLIVLAFFAKFFWEYLQAADGLVDASGYAVGRDFQVFWSSAVLAAEGGALELSDPNRFQALQAERFTHWDGSGYRWAHPPQMLFAIAPLAQLDYLWALAAWSLAGVATYLLATRKAALLAAPGTMVNLYLGQTGLLVGAIYFGALRLAARWPMLAGALCGLITVKPHLGLMLPVAMLAARAWRTAAGAALTVGALVLASGLAFGWEAWRLWLFEALPHQASLLMGGLGQNIGASTFQGARMLDVPLWGAWLAQAPVSLLAGLAVWWAFSRLRIGQISATQAFAVLLLSTCVATPYLFVYDLTLVSPVALYALGQWRQGPWTQTGMRWSDLGELLVWLSLWLLPMLAISLSQRGLPIAGAVLLAALGLSVWRLDGGRKAVRSAPRGANRRPN